MTKASLLLLGLTFLAGCSEQSSTEKAAAPKKAEDVIVKPEKKSSEPSQQEVLSFIATQFKMNSDYSDFRVSIRDKTLVLDNPKGLTKFEFDLERINVFQTFKPKRSEYGSDHYSLMFQCSNNVKCVYLPHFPERKKQFRDREFFEFIFDYAEPGEKIRKAVNHLKTSITGQKDLF